MWETISKYTKFRSFICRTNEKINIESITGLKWGNPLFFFSLTSAVFNRYAVDDEVKCITNYPYVEFSSVDIQGTINVLVIEGNSSAQLNASGQWVNVHNLKNVFKVMELNENNNYTFNYNGNFDYIIMYNDILWCPGLYKYESELIKNGSSYTFNVYEYGAEERVLKNIVQRGGFVIEDRDIYSISISGVANTLLNSNWGVKIDRHIDKMIFKIYVNGEYKTKTESHSVRLSSYHGQYGDNWAYNYNFSTPIMYVDGLNKLNKIEVKYDYECICTDSGFSIMYTKKSNNRYKKRNFKATVLIIPK